MATEERKYRRLTSAEIYNVMRLLTANLAPVTPTHYRYTGEYNDAVVAKEAITAPFDGDARLAVARIRVKNFGPLVETPAAGDQGLQDRVAALENILAAMAKEFGLNLDDLAVKAA